MSLYCAVITVSLLWCSIHKYTNYCQNYCLTTVVWKLVITILYDDFIDIHVCTCMYY